ncbi:electron transfer flavoprotein subunit alpha/FixB family protein [Agrobacterium sp. NPDC089420]|uniref:electron transfer flavoprotein subunit alpha/FixB family protein n=1 Tax=Agrobacterium sp. NPDC089420 TaxID=3363918 RepID=UPI00384B4FC6
MSVMIVAEFIDGKLNRDATAKAVSAVSALGPVTVLCAGSAAGAAALEAAAIAGVAAVHVAESDLYDHGLAEPLAELIVHLAGSHQYIAAAATTHSKNVLPRVAASLDVMVISEVSAILDGDTFERPVYAGNAIQTVRSKDAIKVFTIRTASFEAAGQGQPATITNLPVSDNPALSQWVADDLTRSIRPELASASRVVSGGRGIGSTENFAIVETLADKLDAAVGASRAAVDSGYAPNDWQVGQTGKVVAPELYIAVGISGAIQHLAGMKDSKVIVAINKDEEAPIFQIADYGLVGDLFTVVPELTAKL